MIDSEFSTFLRKYLSLQIQAVAPSLDGRSDIDEACLRAAIERTNYCTSKINGFDGRHFNHLNSGQYATFLYYLAHQLGKSANEIDATRVFLLNKALNGIDLMRWNDEERVTGFKVMVRPFKGLTALMGEMQKLLETQAK